MPESVVPLIAVGVVIVLFIVLLSVLTNNYSLNGIKSKTVGDGQHGTARWATTQEVKKTFANVPFDVASWREGKNLPEVQGLILGSTQRGKQLDALVDRDDVHCLMIGASGVGKTAFFLYPNIEFACASGMSITYDGYAIRQTDLNEMFGERDVFLSIFNPLYFIEELGEDGKKLLERYLPPIPQANVLAQLNALTQQRLSGLQLPSPETFLKNRREEIRELEQNAVYLSGKLDLAQKQRQSSKELSSRLTAQIQDLQQEIASLEARRFENVDLEDLQEQLVQASEQYEELSGEAPETPDTAELDSKLQEFHAKLGARSSEV